MFSLTISWVQHVEQEENPLQQKVRNELSHLQQCVWASINQSAVFSVTDKIHINEASEALLNQTTEGRMHLNNAVATAKPHHSTPQMYQHNTKH